MLLVLILGFNPIVQAYRVEINLPAYSLKVYQGEQVLSQYPIAIGKPSSPTPLGSFSLANKVVDPAWYQAGRKEPVPPGPANPLGSHWLGLDIGGYGLHGTIEPQSIGKAVTQGCIRLLNEDIQYLYDLLPIHTKIEIIYQPLVIEASNVVQPWQMHPDIYGLCDDFTTSFVGIFQELAKQGKGPCQALLVEAQANPLIFSSHLPILAHLLIENRAIAQLTSLLEGSRLLLGLDKKEEKIKPSLLQDRIKFFKCDS